MYHPEVWLIDGKSKKLTTYKEAIARILQHMAQSADNQTAVQQHMAQIMSDIDNSIHRTARYLQSNTIDYAEDRYIVSEQSLYLGHPFHPTPKCKWVFRSGFREICTRMSYIIPIALFSCASRCSAHALCRR